MTMINYMKVVTHLNNIVKLVIDIFTQSFQVMQPKLLSGSECTKTTLVNGCGTHLEKKQPIFTGIIINRLAPLMKSMAAMGFANDAYTTAVMAVSYSFVRYELFFK